VRRQVVDAADLERLATGLGGIGVLGPMVYLGAVEGLRCGEVAGLRIGQVDIEVRTIAVVETSCAGARVLSASGNRSRTLAGGRYPSRGPWPTC
jgi:hypothetical protein